MKVINFIQNIYIYIFHEICLSTTFPFQYSTLVLLPFSTAYYTASSLSTYENLRKFVARIKI